ncbi:MAG: PilN domain-containing protein [Motiliproteus sp.]
MKQQINLFLKQEKVRVPFSALTSLLLLLAIALGLLVTTVLETRGVSALQQEVTLLSQQQLELSTETLILRKQKHPNAESPELRQTRDRLQQQQQVQRRYGEFLAQLPAAGTGIFSPLLTGLSEQALNGVRLERIQASENGTRIALQGHARDAALIPQYLQRLGQASAYENTLFDQFELTEAAAGVEFKLSGRRSGGRG